MPALKEDHKDKNQWSIQNFKQERWNDKKSIGKIGYTIMQPLKQSTNNNDDDIVSPLWKIVIITNE